MDDTVNHIKAVLAKIRPFLRRDGGDVAFVDYKDGIVYLRMYGACVGCGLVDAEITEGVEIILMEEVPGVLGVKLTDEEPPAEGEPAV